MHVRVLINIQICEIACNYIHIYIKAYCAFSKYYIWMMMRVWILRPYMTDLWLTSTELVLQLLLRRRHERWGSLPDGDPGADAGGPHRWPCLLLHHVAPLVSNGVQALPQRRSNSTRMSWINTNCFTNASKLCRDDLVLHETRYKCIFRSHIIAVKGLWNYVVF